MHRSVGKAITDERLRGTLRALVFDFDGTIAETERFGHRVAYNAAFEAFALPWQWDETTYGRLLAIAGGKERLAAYIRAEQPRYANDELPLLVSRLHDEKARRFEALAQTIPLRPGIERLVPTAHRAGIVCAIATTAHPSGVEAVLAKVPEVRACFATIAAGDVVPRKKPAPDIYTYALDAIGVAAGDAIAFEDSHVGLTSARAAGLVTVVTRSTYTRDESFDGAALVLDELGDDVTLAALETLLARD